MIFTIALGAVLVLLLMAAVGYILAKCRVFGGNITSDLSKILVYVCQPALAIYTFKSTEYSLEKLANIGVFALLVLAINVLVMGVSYLIFRKKSVNPIYRIMTIATTMANCAFFMFATIYATIIFLIYNPFKCMITSSINNCSFVTL